MEGSFYILDTRLHELKRFSAEGQLLSQARRNGWGGDQGHPDVPN